MYCRVFFVRKILDEIVYDNRVMMLFVRYDVLYAIVFSGG